MGNFRTPLVKDDRFVPPTPNNIPPHPPPYLLHIFLNPSTEQACHLLHGPKYSSHVDTIIKQPFGKDLAGELRCSAESVLVAVMSLLHNNMHDLALHVFIDLLRAVVPAAQYRGLGAYRPKASARHPGALFLEADTLIAWLASHPIAKSKEPSN